MASKNIAIKEELYHELERRKKGDESFTRIISRLLEDHEKPSKYFGAWKDLTKEEENMILRERKKLRDGWNLRDLS